MKDSNKQTPECADGKSVASRREYRRPAIVMSERLEAMAVVCNDVGMKESPTTCNTGFFQS